MQIVIELDDKTYQKTVDYDLLTVADLNKFIVAIGSGTPLPKGHGRLIDADAYRNEMLDSREFNFFKILDMQQTIIEADKVESEVSE